MRRKYFNDTFCAALVFSPARMKFELECLKEERQSLTFMRAIVNNYDDFDKINDHYHKNHIRTEECQKILAMQPRLQN